MGTIRGILRRWPMMTAVAFACTALAAPAGADDKAIASQQLFDDATADGKRGEWASACPKFAESLRLDFQIGTLYFLADCEEHIHKLASAWSHFTDAAEKAEIAKKPEHARQAQSRADALKPRLCKMILVVSDEVKSTPSLQIFRDGVLIGPAQYGVSIPIDTGKHEIKVSATGKRAWNSTLDVTGEGGTFTVSVPLLQPEADLTVVPTVTASAAPRTGWTVQHTAGVAMMGLGLVGVGIMAGFGFDTGGKHQAAKAHCNEAVTECEQPGIDLERQAHTSATIANVSFAVGASLMVGGVAVFLLAPSLSKPQPNMGTSAPRASLAVTVLPAGTFMSFQGAF